MKFITLASGSKGNCSLLQTDNTKILIDAGINLGEIEQKLLALEVEPTSIKAILITHEHSDHIKNVASFAKKYGTKIYAHKNEWEILTKKLGYIEPSQKVEFFENTFYIDDLTINYFILPHDANLCVGYSFYNQGNKISIATDLGIYNKAILDNLRDSNLLIIEANHDEKLLLNNPKYSSILKRRILSNKGHLSNITCAKLITEIYSSNLKQVVLAHLSEENNSPNLAYSTVKNEILKAGIIEGKHLFIDVATQHNMGHLFEIKSNE